MKLSADHYYVALDFETTGLDKEKDEPIQIGLVVADHTFTIVDTYESLIKPRKNISELKSIVRHITGLQLDDLDDAPRMEEVLPTIQTLLQDKSVILVGHNIQFDLDFLQQYRSDFEPTGLIDTYVRSQMLLHYQPSYSLEVLRKNLAENNEESLQFTTRDGLLNLDTHEGYHDALFDSYISLGLFRSLVNKLYQLHLQYPHIDSLIQKSQLLSNFFVSEEKVQRICKLPKLVKPQPTSSQRISHSTPLDLESLPSQSTRYIGNFSLYELLEKTASQGSHIYAVHTRQKLDIVKHHLQRLGHTQLGFAKEEQDRDHNLLEQLASKDVLADFETSFFIKYLSHHLQGLRVIDLRDKDHRVYQLCKQASSTKPHDIMITTHAGLYHLLDDPVYNNHTIVFLDPDWWYQTYNRYQSQPVDLHYIADLMDTWYYVFRRRATLYDDTAHWKSLSALLYSLKQSFSVYLGTLGIEVTKLFTGTADTSREVTDILDNDLFWQSNKLREKLSHIATQLWHDRGDESTMLTTQWERLIEVFSHLSVIEKKLHNNKYLHYTYSLVHNYTDYSEFLDIFGKQKVLFLSHYKKSNTRLVQNNHTDIKPLPQLTNAGQLISHIKQHQWKRAFVLSSAKHVSEKLFGSLTHDSSFDSYSILGERITGGTGKNIFLMKEATNYIGIGGYYFLLAIFAKNIPLDIIIIHHAHGPLKELIIADCLYFAPHHAPKISPG